MDPLNIRQDNLRYRVMIGVGGIGSGAFFALNGNQTLGREESRGGRFIDRRDYCKLHIVSHYVRVLTGSGFQVIPLGKVGDDDVGHKLIGEMKEAGLDMRWVQASPEDQTLFSFCFTYPDGSGGNMTTDNSASSKADPSFIASAEDEFARFSGEGIALALPEVPLEARVALLRLGTRYGFYRVASFTSSEMPEVMASGILSYVDLLAINLDEAAAALGGDCEGREPEEIVQSAVRFFRSINPNISVSITAGRQGSWSYEETAMSHVPAFETDVCSTAGAGDAHLSGIIVGHAAGLPLAKAQQLAALISSLSVTSPHTINKQISRSALLAFAQEQGIYLFPEVQLLLRNP